MIAIFPQARLAYLLTVLLVMPAGACGDSATDPDGDRTASVAGVYFGTITFDPASCTPSVPPDYDPERFTIRTLLDVTQSGTTVNGIDHLGPGVTLSGSVSANRVALRQAWAISDSTASANFQVDYNLILDSANGLTGNGSYRADGTVKPSNVRIICTRSMRLDARRTGPIVDLAAIPCSGEMTARSISSSTQTLIVWKNESDRDLRLSWIDFEGRAVFHGVLLPGSLGSTVTRTNHAFILTNSSDRCVGIYIPQVEGPNRVTLR